MRREVEVDTRLAELHGQLSRVEAALDWNKLTLALYAGIKAEWVTRTRRGVRQSASEVAATLAGMLADGKLPSYKEAPARAALANREQLLGERAEIRFKLDAQEGGRGGPRAHRHGRGGETRGRADGRVVRAQGGPVMKLKEKS